MIHSALSRADRGDYFCPQNGAADKHTPSPGSVHQRAKCIPASARPLFPNPLSGGDGRFRLVIDTGRTDRRPRRAEPRALHPVRRAYPLRRAGREAGPSHLRRSPKANAASGIGWSDGDYREPPIPRGWPAVPAQDKGIDVGRAVDFVKPATVDKHHVGVMMSIPRQRPAASPRGRPRP